jgi:hypothetical protein
MQWDGEGSARDPCCTAQPARKYGASAQVPLGFQVADGSPVCSWGTYRLINSLSKR